MTGDGERRLRHVDGAPARRASDWAWLAGVIEGEGSCRLVARSSPQIEVTNTNPHILFRCAQIAGAGLRIRRSGASRQRNCYRWTVSGDEARRVLAAVAPYLVTKRDQADILLAHVKLPPGHRLTQAQRDERAAADRRLRALKRFRHPPPPA